MIPEEVIEDIIIPFMGDSIDTICLMRYVSCSMMKKCRSLRTQDIQQWSTCREAWENALIHDNLYIFTILMRLTDPKEETRCVITIKDMIDLTMKHVSRNIFHFMMDHRLLYRNTLMYLRQIPNIEIAVKKKLITLRETCTLLICMRCHEFVIVYILDVVRKYMTKEEQSLILSFMREEAIPLPNRDSFVVNEDEIPDL